MSVTLARAEVVEVERAVGLAAFRRGAAALAVPARAGDLQPAPADHVLAHVEDVARPAAVCVNRHGLERLGDADRLDHLRGEHAAGRRHQLRRLPAAASSNPARSQPGISGARRNLRRRIRCWRGSGRRWSASRTRR